MNPPRYRSLYHIPKPEELPKTVGKTAFAATFGWTTGQLLAHLVRQTIDTAATVTVIAARTIAVVGGALALLWGLRYLFG